MTFANPLALLWALAAIPVVLLYRRRMRLRRIDVATAMFWEQVFAEERSRQAWHRWRHGASLAVHLVVLLLLVLAAAEPLLPGPRTLVIVIDNSASMNAADVEPSRLERAREAASRVVAGLRHCDRAAVLAAGDAVGVRCGLANNHDTLRKAIGEVASTWGASRVEDAVKVARTLLDGAPQGRVLVLSDALFPAAEELAQADDVKLVRVGEPAANLAVTRLAARRSPVDPLKAQVLVEATGFADEPAETQLDVRVNDQPHDVWSIRVGGDGRWQQVFELSVPDGSRLAARLASEDALTADDHRAVDVPPAAGGGSAAGARRGSPDPADPDDPTGLSPAESDLRVPVTIGIPVEAFPFPSPGVPPWLVLVLLAAALFTAEWCLYHRRWLT